MAWMQIQFVNLPRLLLVFILLASACAPVAKRVVIQVDGDRIVVDTNAATVQDVLREQNIALVENDRVEPPLYAEVSRSETINITRVQIQTATELRPIPFTRKLVKDETSTDGQLRVIQLGTNGTVVITYTLAFEDGKETSRREVARKIIAQPKEEILAIGTLGSLLSVPISGAVVYLSNGNAWVMRNSSSDRRPLTTTGDLDGRVFSHSADGRFLLFSRAADDASNSLNSLWVVDTLILGESPRGLPIEDVLFAQLTADGQSIAYSTGEKTSGAPGWKARNDLWIASLAMNDGLPVLSGKQQIWKPGTPAPFSWWGTNFSLSPDGKAIAYAFANEIGFLDLSNRAQAAQQPRRTLKKFAAFQTRADWVWVPQLSWSPDSRFVIGVVHAPLDSPNIATENPSFEVWALARDGSVNAPLAKQTGMWSLPIWSSWDDKRDSRIAFGVALSPTDSERSRYALFVMDRDGGNKKQIFPQAKEEGLNVVQVAWSPNVRQLIAVRENDLWLYDSATTRWTQLTANGATSLVRWAR